MGNSANIFFCASFFFSCGSGWIFSPSDAEDDGGIKDAVEAISGDPIDDVEQQNEFPDDGFHDEEGEGVVVDFSKLGEPVDKTLPGKKSIRFLNSCNGFACVAFSDESAASGNRLKAFYGHIYRNPEKGVEAKEFLYDAYFGARYGNESRWLYEIPPASTGYIRSTNIIHAAYEVSGGRIDTFYFTPMTSGGRIAVFLIKAGGGAFSDVASLINVHAGGEGDSGGETVTFDAGSGAMIEKKGDNIFGYKPLPGGFRYTAGEFGEPENPFDAFREGKDFMDKIAGKDDISCGFQWKAPVEAEEFWAGVAVSFRNDGSEENLKKGMDSFIDGRNAYDILVDEIGYWENFFEEVKFPEGLTETEEILYRRSLVVLKTAQVREEGKSFGQIPASLPQDKTDASSWNITWVRDGAYAAKALLKAGLAGEAGNFLKFILNGNAGFFKEFVGSDYLVSVCRYYGDGVEESDDNGFGYNIEFDNFGLFLQAYSGFSGYDESLFADIGNVKSLVADVLINLIEPELKILKPDSSIWERHWLDGFPNGKKRFTYTTINAIKGLKEFGSLLAARGGDGKKYLDAAEILFSGFAERLVKGNVIVSSYEEASDPQGKYIDGSVVEAVNFGIASENAAKATMIMFEKKLKAGNGGPGFKRNDDGGGTAN
ncbi:MAG: hypothetical protein FJ088_06280, partial [Deltaproteobacteria bacterium]|nr:hypothetical protein [Deltaproteobacteria bacterium]